MSSLRAVQQASELKNVQKKLGVLALRWDPCRNQFDTDRLKPIVEGLGEQLQPLTADKRLKDVKGLTLVDGSIVEALPRIAMASFPAAQASGGDKMKWTLHTHFEVDRSIPTRIDVTPTAGGEHDERAVMARTVAGDRTYVMDRGYAKFELFNRIVDAGSSYVCRIRDNSVYDVVDERASTDADREARVLSDQMISLGCGSAKSSPNHPVRLVVIKAGELSSESQQV